MLKDLSTGIDPRKIFLVLVNEEELYVLGKHPQISERLLKVQAYVFVCYLLVRSFSVDF